MEDLTWFFSKNSIKTDKNTIQNKLNKKTLLEIKAKNTQLQRELKALNKEEKINIRFQEVKELEFRHKYEKYLTRGNFETSLQKKGTWKKAAKHNFSNNMSTQQVMPLHKLIYTKGEVDIEKVFCLHLLSVQSTEMGSFIEKRNLQLFPKRSKPNMIEASALPFYITEVIKRTDPELKYEPVDGQDVLILVNTNLEKLIISILEVLAIVSPSKLAMIKELAKNRRSIQEIMGKAKISNLLAQLKDNPLFMKISNYRLEVAHFQTEPSSDPNILSVSQIKVRDRSSKLHQLQDEIRKSISKYTDEDITNSETWSMLHKNLCSCREMCSRSSLTSGKAIALLSDDGSGFAVITSSRCRLPKVSSSIFCPSLTAIIKSSPNQTIMDRSSGYSMNAKLLPMFKKEQQHLLSSIIYKVNNAQRILIGKKSAELQSLSINKFDQKKIPLETIMKDVFSQKSLISLASNSTTEELKLMFQPRCRGGLNLGTFLMGSMNKKMRKLPSKEVLQSNWDYEKGAVPLIIQQERAVMQTALMKQEIFASETRTKINKFIVSQNPGCK